MLAIYVLACLVILNLITKSDRNGCVTYLSLTVISLNGNVSGLGTPPARLIVFSLAFTSAAAVKTDKGNVFI